MTQVLEDEKNNHHHHDGSLGILTQWKNISKEREKNSRLYLSLSSKRCRIKVRGIIYFCKEILSCLSIPFLEQWSHLIRSCILFLLDFVGTKISLLYVLSPYFPLQNCFVLQRKLSYSCRQENPYLLGFALQLQPLNSFQRLLLFFGLEPQLAHLRLSLSFPACHHLLVFDQDSLVCLQCLPPCIKVDNIIIKNLGVYRRHLPRKKNFFTEVNTKGESETEQDQVSIYQSCYWNASCNSIYMQSYHSIWRKKPPSFIKLRLGRRDESN